MGDFEEHHLSLWVLRTPREHSAPDPWSVPCLPLQGPSYTLTQAPQWP